MGGNASKQQESPHVQQDLLDSADCDPQETRYEHVGALSISKSILNTMKVTETSVTVPKTFPINTIPYILLRIGGKAGLVDRNLAVKYLSLWTQTTNKTNQTTLKNLKDLLSLVVGSIESIQIYKRRSQSRPTQFNHRFIASIMTRNSEPSTVCFVVTPAIHMMHIRVRRELEFLDTIFHMHTHAVQRMPDHRSSALVALPQLSMVFDSP